jgi:hypothetical protein
MFGTIVFNGALGFVAIVTYASLIQDLQAEIVDSTAAFPWIEVFKRAVGSPAGAIEMTVPIIVVSRALNRRSTKTTSAQVSFGMAINSTAAASRQA